MNDLLGNQRGEKRERTEVESCKSSSSQDSSSREDLNTPDNKKRKAGDDREKVKGEKEKVKEVIEKTKEVKIPRDLMFSCAACGVEDADYKTLERHVKAQHVGEDHELVLASIWVPETLDALKTFQCGVKSCGIQYIGAKEGDLRAHIISEHGEYYVNICSGRNLIRICRICSGKFSSDEELTHHIQMWHSSKCFANAEQKKQLTARLNASFSPEVNRNVITRPEEREERKNYQPIRVSKPHMDLEKKKTECVKDRLTFSQKLNEEDENNVEEDDFDLKHKLKKFREKYCEACQVSTRDWAEHKLSSAHQANDRKKVRCLYCPRRLMYSHLKDHLKREHRGMSFTCNVGHYCDVSLMDISKMVEHINDNHKKCVSSVIETYGAHWENSSIPSCGERLPELLLLPSDLRSLSCRLCRATFLCQGQAALTEHFRCRHPELHTGQYQHSIVYSCRACKGVVFGAEYHLMNHIRQVHGSHSDHLQSFAEPKVHPKREEVNERKLTKKTLKPEPNTENEDIEKYNKIISKIKTKRKVKRTQTINTFSTIKDRLLAEFDKKQPDDVFDEMQDWAPTTEAVCQVCDIKLFKSRLESHQSRQHQDQLFSCDGSCGSKMSSPWKDQVLDHLRNVHKLTNNSDNDLIEGKMELPRNLEMVRCKGGKCNPEATLLARGLPSVKRRMVSHSNIKHQGEDIKQCFVLGCRACPKVWTLEEVKDWSVHCKQFHLRRGVKESQEDVTEHPQGGDEPPS